MENGDGSRYEINANKEKFREKVRKVQKNGGRAARKTQNKVSKIKI